MGQKLHQLPGGGAVLVPDDATPTELRTIEAQERLGPPRSTGAQILDAINRAADISSITREGGFNEDTLRAVQAAAARRPTGRVEQSVAPFVGSTVGSIIGQRGGPVGAALGAGAGDVAGELAGSVIFGTPTPDVSTLATRGAVVAGTELLGRGVIGGARKIGEAMSISPSVNARAISEAARAIGGPIKVSDVAESRAVAMLERGMAQTPTGQGPISQRVREQVAAAERAADEWMGGLGPSLARDRVGTGQAVTRQIERTLARTGTVEDRLFGDVTRQASGLTVEFEPLKNIVTYLGRDTGQPLGAQARRILDVKLNPDGTVGWRQARAWQKEFGANIERGELISQTPTSEQKLLFRTISEAMEGAMARSGDPTTQALFRQARDFAARRRELFVDSGISRLMETDPEKVVALLGAAGGPTAVQRAREAILGQSGAVVPDPRASEAWNLVRRHIFEGIFAPASEGGVKKEVRGIGERVISGADLERRLGKIGADTLAELLNETERKALANIVTYAKAIQASERVAATGYTSMTPMGFGLQAFITGAGGGVGASLGGPAGGAVGAATAYLLVPPILARALVNQRAAELIASPAFARVAEHVRLGGKIGAESVKVLGRLSAVLLTRPAPTEQ